MINDYTIYKPTCSTVESILKLSEKELEQILSLPVKIDGSMLEGGG